MGTTNNVRELQLIDTECEGRVDSSILNCEHCAKLKRQDSKKTPRLGHIPMPFDDHSTGTRNAMAPQ